MAAETLIQNLLHKELYDHDVLYFRVIETHTSYIILTGHYAYKIKRTIQFDFLDYSTLERRHYYCEQELRLNQRTAAEIYLAVIPIYGTAAQPYLQPSAPSAVAIEYAVKMREFPQEQLLSQLIQTDALTKQHFIQLAQTVATFHQTAEPCLTEAYGQADTIHSPVADNFITIQANLAQCAACATDATTHGQWAQAEQTLKVVAQQTQALYQKHVAYFALRKQQGFIRACHGDLHLNNILLLHDQPILFDCIEFNESFRWIDVCAEIAFLTMDLLDQNRADFANIFLNYYLEYTGDYHALTLLPYYQCYRAMIRAKVAILTALFYPNDATWTQKHFQQFFHYLDLAKHLLTDTSPSFMILMHGLSGSGKSFLSEQLLTQANLIRIRSDVERKRLLQLPTHEPIPEHLKASAYQASHHEKTHRYLEELAATIIEAHYAVLIDATFLRQQRRHQFITLANRRSIAWFIIATYAPHAFLVKMLAHRKNRYHEPSDATEQVILMQEALLEPLTEQEKEHSLLLDSSQIDWSNPEKIAQLLEQIKHCFPHQLMRTKQQHE